jgi:DNA (cytosine-5)-methyltransferase 1
MCIVIRYGTKEEHSLIVVTIRINLSRLSGRAGLKMVEEKGAEFARHRARARMSIDEVSHLLTLSRRQIRDIETGNSVVPSLEFKILKAHANNVQGAIVSEGPSFRFIDLFAGIGGLRRGFESAGGQCVFTSEIDEYAQRTYRANFPDDHEIVGDIQGIEASEIPEHDVLLAGFPCQPFSIAGVSKKNSLGREHGFMDKAQGTLFFDVLRILKHHRPAAFLLENVKNLKSHNKGDTFKTILGALENELGYSVHY